MVSRDGERTVDKVLCGSNQKQNRPCVHNLVVLAIQDLWRTKHNCCGFLTMPSIVSYSISDANKCKTCHNGSLWTKFLSGLQCNVEILLVSGPAVCPSGPLHFEYCRHYLA